MQVKKVNPIFRGKTHFFIPPIYGGCRESEKVAFYWRKISGDFFMI